MQHGVGLADITLGQGLNYKLENYEEYKWTASIVSDKLADNESKLYKPVVNQMLGVIKANHDTTFKGVASGGWKCAWKNELTFNPTCAQIIKKTAEREDGNEHLYTLEVGDIYYTNGALTHQNYDLETIQPIGIVGYITMNGDGNYWTEKDVVISKKTVGGHALVMCLKTIGSTGSTKAAQEDYKNNGDKGAKVKAYIGTGYAWYSLESDADRPRVNSKSLLVNSYNQPYGSGYTETDALIKKWDSDAAAAYYAQNYKTLPANSAKCTGWFLPTAGQYYAVMTSLGAPFSNDWIGIFDRVFLSAGYYGFFDNMTTVTKNINYKLKKVGDSNHTEFFGEVNTWAWTSSEYSSTHAVFIDSGVDDGGSWGAGSVRFVGDYRSKPTLHPVRPFLAF